VWALEDFAFRTDHEGEVIPTLWLNLTQVSDELKSLTPMQTSR
jgi:hypothetical protein